MRFKTFENYLEKKTQDLIFFIKQNKYFLISCFFIGILVLLSEITEGTYYYEDYGSEGNSWNSEKTRWLLRMIMRALGPFGFAPAYYIFFSILLGTIITYYLAEIFKIKQEIQKVLMFGIFFTCPFFVTRLDYDIDGKVWYALAQLFVVIAIYTTRKTNIVNYIKSSLLIMLIWAIYPIPINAFIAISLFSLCLFTANNKFRLDEMKKGLFVFGVRIGAFFTGTIMYLLSVKFFVTLDKWSQDRYQVETPSISSLFSKLELFISQSSTIYFKEHIMYPRALKILFIILFLIAIISLLIKVFNNDSKFQNKLTKSFLVVLILFIGLISYQISSFAMKGFLTNFHTLAEVAFSYVFILVLIYKYANKTIIKISYIVTIQNRHDTIMTTRLFSRIENHSEFNPEKEKKYTVFFWGNANIDLPKDLDFQSKFRQDPLIDARGKSIYQHFWTETLELKRYAPNIFNTSGIYDTELKEKVTPHINKMETWPKKGFIKFLEDEKLIILKMND